MAERPNVGLAALIAAKIACCGALILASTGALSLAGVAGWLRGEGIVWLAIAAIAAMVLYLWWRRRRADPVGVPRRTRAMASPPRSNRADITRD